MTRHHRYRLFVSFVNAIAILLLCNSISVQAQTSVSVFGGVETVFRWREARCGDHHLPDSPARALRLADGRILLTASQFTNIPFIGTDFQDLRPACDLSSRADENSDWRQFNDRVWIQALARLQDGSIFALASHEYAGSRHAGKCTAPGSACWFSSITAMVAPAGTLKFRTLPLTDRVIASSPEKYEQDKVQRTGFFSTTNIIYESDFAYALLYNEGIHGQNRGMCLIRANKNDLLSGWKALSNGRFDAQLKPFEQRSQSRPICDVVGENVFSDVVRSVVRLPNNGPWMATFAKLRSKSPDDKTISGIYYSLSDDLINWNQANLLIELLPFVVQKEAGIYFQYPSIIDHESRSENFFDIHSKPYLYLVRYNLWPDRRQGGDRDLVRIPLQISSGTR